MIKYCGGDGAGACDVEVAECGGGAAKGGECLIEAEGAPGAGPSPHGLVATFLHEAKGAGVAEGSGESVAGVGFGDGEGVAVGPGDGDGGVVGV